MRDDHSNNAKEHDHSRGPSWAAMHLQHCNFSVDEGNSQRWAKAARGARWSVVEGTSEKLPPKPPFSTTK